MDPEDLIPRLPRPRALQPFPTCQALVSRQGGAAGSTQLRGSVPHCPFSAGLQGPQRPRPLPQCLPGWPVAGIRWASGGAALPWGLGGGPGAESPSAVPRLRRWLGAALGGGLRPLREDCARGGRGEECRLEPPPYRLPGRRGSVSMRPGVPGPVGAVLCLGAFTGLWPQGGRSAAAEPGPGGPAGGGQHGPAAERLHPARGARCAARPLAGSLRGGAPGRPAAAHLPRQGVGAMGEGAAEGRGGGAAGRGGAAQPTSPSCSQ